MIQALTGNIGHCNVINMGESVLGIFATLLPEGPVDAQSVALKAA